ncbi:MAG: hypothetical protein GY715_17240 [Planctomycetes bacterium]|nr:hypothetical protein [Planctomycetota bacterium]
MPFRTGTVAFARFRVSGGPHALTPSVLESLAAGVMAESGVGSPPEVQAGWISGRHVFDTTFDPDATVFGDSALFAIRVDTNRVPAEIRRAFRLMAVSARGPGEDRREQEAGRREVDEEAEARCRAELSAGRHRRSKMVPVLWDVPRRLILAPVFSDTLRSVLAEHMRATLDASIEPLSAGALAAEHLSASGRSRDYEDLAPSSFTAPPAATLEREGRGDGPPVPWSRLGPQPKDFLGNEFLIWLWAQGEIGSAAIDTEGGPVALVFDQSLDMDCAWDVAGRQTLRATGPTRLPEAAKGLQNGKWPRKAGLVLAARGDQWTLTFQGDRFLVTGCRLATPEEAPASERERTEQRLASIETLDGVLVDLFHAFLERRICSGWQGERQAIREWITTRTGRRATAPVELPVELPV